MRTSSPPPDVHAAESRDARDAPSSVFAATPQVSVSMHTHPPSAPAVDAAINEIVVFTVREPHEVLNPCDALVYELSGVTTHDVFGVPSSTTDMSPTSTSTTYRRSTSRRTVGTSSYGVLKDVPGVSSDPLHATEAYPTTTRVHPVRTSPVATPASEGHTTNNEFLVCLPDVKNGVLDLCSSTTQDLNDARSSPAPSEKTAQNAGNVEQGGCEEIKKGKRRREEEGREASRENEHEGSRTADSRFDLGMAMSSPYMSDTGCMYEDSTSCEFTSTGRVAEQGTDLIVLDNEADVVFDDADLGHLTSTSISRCSSCNQCRPMYAQGQDLVRAPCTLEYSGRISNINRTPSIGYFRHLKTTGSVDSTSDDSHVVAHPTSPSSKHLPTITDRGIWPGHPDVAPFSSPPSSEGGATLSSPELGPLHDREETSYDYDGIQRLHDTILQWHLAEKIFGDLLNVSNFPLIYDHHIRRHNISPQDWKETQTYLQQHLYIVRCLSFIYNPTMATVDVYSPTSLHQIVTNSMDKNIVRMSKVNGPQTISIDGARGLITDNVGHTPDSVISISTTRRLPSGDLIYIARDTSVGETSFTQVLEDMLGQIHVAMGSGRDDKIVPLLFTGINIETEDYIDPDPEHSAPDAGGFIKGGGAANDVLSTGWKRGGEVLMKRAKAQWYMFIPEDREELGGCLKIWHERKDWVIWKYGVPIQRVYEPGTHAFDAREFALGRYRAAIAKIRAAAHNQRILALLMEADQTGNAAVLKELSPADLADNINFEEPPIPDPIPDFITDVEVGARQKAQDHWNRHGYRAETNNVVPLNDSQERAQYRKFMESLKRVLEEDEAPGDAEVIADFRKRQRFSTPSPPPPPKPPQPPRLKVEDSPEEDEHSETSDEHSGGSAQSSFDVPRSLAKTDEYALATGRTLRSEARPPGRRGQRMAGSIDVGQSITEQEQHSLIMLLEATPNLNSVLSNLLARLQATRATRDLPKNDLIQTGLELYCCVTKYNRETSPQATINTVSLARSLAYQAASVAASKDANTVWDSDQLKAPSQSSKATVHKFFTKLTSNLSEQVSVECSCGVLIPSSRTLAFGAPSSKQRPGSPKEHSKIGFLWAANLPLQQEANLRVPFGAVDGHSAQDIGNMLRWPDGMLMLCYFWDQLIGAADSPAGRLVKEVVIPFISNLHKHYPTMLEDVFAVNTSIGNLDANDALFDSLKSNTFSLVPRLKSVWTSCDERVLVPVTSPISTATVLRPASPIQQLYQLSPLSPSTSPLSPLTPLSSPLSSPHLFGLGLGLSVLPPIPAIPVIVTSYDPAKKNNVRYPAPRDKVENIAWTETARSWARKAIVPLQEMYNAGERVSQQRYVSVPVNLISDTLNIRGRDNGLIASICTSMPEAMKRHLMDRLVACFDSDPFKPVDSNSANGGRTFEAIHFSWYNRHCTVDMEDHQGIYQSLKKTFADVFSWVDEKLQSVLPVEYERLEATAAILPGNNASVVNPFVGLVVNLNVVTRAHRDSKDDSVCLVLPIGDFAGAASSLLPFDILMATRQSARNAARQTTTKPKTAKSSAKSTSASKKSGATKTSLPQAATGSKRPRQETPVPDGKTSQGDILSPSEKKMYDRLKAKMEQAEKQAAADRRSNTQKLSTAMLLAENASDGDVEEHVEEEGADEADEDEQPRRKKLKKNVVINDSDDEDRDQLVDEDEEVQVKSSEPDEAPDTPPQRAKPKPKPAYGKNKGRDAESGESEKDDGTLPTLDEGERSLAKALGHRSPAAKQKATTKTSRTAKIPDDDDSGSDYGEHRRTTPTPTQPVKGKKVWRMDAVVIDSPRKKVKVVDRKEKGKVIVQKKKQKKKEIDWLDTDMESDSDTEKEADDDEEDDELGRDDDVWQEGSEDEEMDDDSGDEVIVVKAPKSKNSYSKGKASARGRGSANRVKSEGRRRAQARDLPETLRAVASCSQMYLRLRLSLEHAWTSEKMQNSSQLPYKHTLIKRAIRDARSHRAEDGKKIPYLVSGFKILQTPGKNHLRGQVATIVWTGVCQFRNDVKKKAKIVVDSAYGLAGLSTQRRVAAATFLLKFNMQGRFSMPNFIFGDIDIAWQANDALEVDTKASVVNRKKPFHHRAISDVIAQHWFHGHRDFASVAANDRFSEVPNNLIALVCNAIEAALVDIATGTHNFTNKMYAPKWGNIMGILDQFEHKAPDAYESMKALIWTNVMALVDEQKASKLKDQAEAEVDVGGRGRAAVEAAAAAVEAAAAAVEAVVVEPAVEAAAAAVEAVVVEAIVEAVVVEAAAVEAVVIEAIIVEDVEAIVIEAWTWTIGAASTAEQESASQLQTSAVHEDSDDGPSPRYPIQQSIIYVNMSTLGMGYEYAVMSSV
ncbi:uncharacterized protein B0H18DRAFT_954689 [Fomitopsis serialis]|uniref:uncharacterized protein n=1 Tax=Fomitopsis serialis TaxID=139415 RepID=UPI002008C7B4|nr:uncharacterized protein B0H18DRAFT_954689 [Neoantrodia serialis]KAH9926365.1 hypothetical protein B0H18DRAFT_954689 [Neoantrodia serialis]